MRLWEVRQGARLLSITPQHLLSNPQPDIVCVEVLGILDRLELVGVLLAENPEGESPEAIIWALFTFWQRRPCSEIGEEATSLNSISYFSVTTLCLL